jgi:hypothetical protein
VGLTGLAALPAAYSTVPDRRGQVARRDAIDDSDRRNDAQLAAIFAARNRQGIDDQDRANDAQTLAAARQVQGMQGVDDADRLNDARMLAAQRMQAVDDRDRANDVRSMLPRQTAPAQQAIQQARFMQQPDRQEQSRVGTLFNTIFSGKDYQSSGGQLLRGSPEGQRTVNWGDPDSAADFFRASSAAQKLRGAGQDFRGASGSDIDYQNRMAANYGSIKDDEGKAKGGAVENKPTKEAMLHKSLEIIHHMIRNR